MPYIFSQILLIETFLKAREGFTKSLLCQTLKSVILKDGQMDLRYTFF